MQMDAVEETGVTTAGTAGQRTVAFHTLGCKLNYSETSTLARQLENDGFLQKKWDEAADVYVINTCSVTENADKECRMLVRRIGRRAPGAFVVITGCYAQLKPQEIARIEGVNLVLGAAEKFELTKHLADLTRLPEGARIHACDIDEVHGFKASHSIASRTRTFLKVQDGCDYGCTFCTIPKARGHSRSDAIPNVLAQVAALKEQGVKEVVLTGINLGDFGKGFDGGRLREESFLELMLALEAAPGPERYRISSIEPNLLSPEIIDAVAHSKRFMPHFHIPLQSGSNRILGLMRRRYQRELYADRVAMIKAAMPHCCIGADVITGFPSESDADFRETLDFLTGLDVSYLHVFTYSERDDTAALEIKPIVPVAVRQQRNKILRELSYRKMKRFEAQHTGEARPVLWEKSKQPGMLEGYTDNGIRVIAPKGEGMYGNITPWQL